jgi:O-antigen ligase
LSVVSSEGALGTAPSKPSEIELVDAPTRERGTPLQLVGQIALALLAPAAVVYLAFNAGGYFPNTPGLVAIVFIVAIVLRCMLAERPFEGFSRALAVPLAALALYGGWQLSSAAWSHATARALDSYNRTLLYLLALMLFGSLRYTRARAGWMVRALFTGMAFVCLAGLVSRVLPHVWPTAPSFYANRLNYPLTYWNADGMLAALALILGLHLSADEAEHWSVRVLAAAVLPAIAVTLLLTFSRGALGVAVIGLLAYCVLTRLHTLPTALLAVVPPTAIALRSAWDATALASNQPTSGQAIAQGHHVAAVVGACMLAAGVLRAVQIPADRRARTLRATRDLPRRARAGARLGLAALIAIVALALGAAGFVHREYDKFVRGNGGPSVTNTRDRLTDPANNGRLSLWKAALRIARTNELRGAGAGTYQLRYPRYRTEAQQYVVDAHSLYLQSLAELGIVGLALIALVVLSILACLAARIRGPDRALYAALFAATLAWAIHQGFDWDWQMPAVTLGVFALAGMALARSRDGRPGRGGLPAGRTPVAIAWLALAVAPLLVSTSYARLQKSGRELGRRDCASAKRDALSSLSLSARRPQAYTVIGVCDLEQGFAQAAVPAMAKAAALEPQSWEGEFWLAVARAGAGLDPHAQIARAIALNPLEHGLRNTQSVLGGGDPRAWEAAAPRLRREALGSGKFVIAHL